MAVHRTTIWRDLDGRTLQVSVACLDDAWEPHAVVTEHVGPFDDLEEVLEAAWGAAHHLSRLRAHQGSLL